MIEFIKKNIIWIVCILGSIVRLLYGYFYEPWQEAPDQMAWELIIEQGKFQYDHLIHYPHEGGTIVLSLLSHIVELFTDFSSLTVVAFCVDFCFRFIQLKIVQHVFNLKTAIIFGVWSVFAVPILLPWATVNYGLHAISSVFPFLLLWILTKKHTSSRAYWSVGISLGLILWFSYSNIVLIPVFISYVVFRYPKNKQWRFAVFGFAIVMIFHVLVRMFADAGFHLNEFGITAIRDVNFSLGDVPILNRLYQLPSVIANGALVLPNETAFYSGMKILYYIFGFIALIGLFFRYRKHEFRKEILIISSIILTFFIAYIVSPFFTDSVTGNYVTHRHLTYIMPFVSLLMIVGLTAVRYHQIVIVFLLLGMVRSFQFFATEKTPHNEIFVKATGMILGTKFGHDQEVLYAILDKNSEDKELLLFGIGWGMSTTLMQDADSLNDDQIALKIAHLVDTFFNYSSDERISIYQGIKFSFSDDVTPRMDKQLFKKIESIINQRAMKSLQE
ncbi:hypothetical protein [Kordia sp.]|uniref:hypothetical protein n=1 Tax=Kordia sp. TaxID=1965332 RepID=UPI003D2BA834